MPDPSLLTRLLARMKADVLNGSQMSSAGTWRAQEFLNAADG